LLHKYEAFSIYILTHYTPTRHHRYIDCEYVARAHAYSEARHRNGLGLVATHEDFAFDYGMCCWCVTCPVCRRIVFASERL